MGSFGGRDWRRLINLSELINQRLLMACHDLSTDECVHIHSSVFENVIEALNRTLSSMNGSIDGHNITDNITEPDALTAPLVPPLWAQIIYYLFFIPIVIVAAGGNSVIIYIVLRYRNLCSATYHYFMLNLSISDALISIFNVSFNFLYMLYNDWPFGVFYCRFSLFISHATISASVFTFVIIAIDRYMIIIKPLSPRLSRKTAVFIIIGIWCLATTISVPPAYYAILTSYDRFVDGRVRYYCFSQWPNGGFDGSDAFRFNLFFSLTTYFIPVTTLAVTYTRIGVELWGSKAIGEQTALQTENIRTKRKVVKMMVVIVVIFTVCWLPQNLYFLVTAYVDKNDLYKDQNLLQHTYLAIYWLAMSNAMYNPIIYCYMSTRFRQGVKSVFRCCPFVHYQAEEEMNKMASLSVRFAARRGDQRGRTTRTFGNSESNLINHRHHHSHFSNACS